jgi:hypothetical protein
MTGKPEHDNDGPLPEDDRIIGVAFRRSLALLVVVASVAALVAAVLLLNVRAENEVAVVEREAVAAPNALESPPESAPQLPFTDITVAAGIRWLRENGAVGAKLLPETMGGGGAFFDYDNDGDPDLLLIGGKRWRDRGSGPASIAVYRNDGGAFTESTQQSGMDVRLQGMGIAVGDIDNDGLTDVYVTALGRNRLYRNLGGGSFSDVTASAGVAGGDEWSSSAGFLDFDGDGWLDLFVANYIEWSEELDRELHFTLNGTDRAYGPPTQYPGTQCVLYRNRRDGTFEDVSERAGIRVLNPNTGVAKGKALAVSFADFDDNGAIDIFVANDTVDNFLFLNQGNGTFAEMGRAWGVATDNNGNATGAMGVDSAVRHDDDRRAIVVGNFANEASSFFVQSARGGGFTDLANLEGVGSESRLRLSFGLFFFDADLDGRLDLLQSNGHLENEINDVQPSQTYRQEAQLFWNSGQRRRAYVALAASSVRDLSNPIVGRGATYADIDGDGDLDVLLLQPQGAPVLLRNDQALGNHWLRVHLEGGDGVNRDAIGAWVELTANGQTQRRQVMPTRSYLSQVESVLTFGLGQTSSVESLLVRWPNGRTQSVGVQGVDREIRVTYNPSADG